MNNADILKIAISLYSEHEIKVAKHTPYRFMDCETDFVDRRGGDATKIIITDILRKLITAHLYR